jgi:hypothetical protein
MRFSDAKLTKLEKQLADADKLVIYRQAEVGQLKAKLAQRTDDYRLRDADILELARAACEIRQGDAFGLRRLEEFMDSLEPRWRSM